ncbi:MAG: hypothetical protein AB7I45_11975 [Planctomycetota bacterium]
MVLAMSLAATMLLSWLGWLDDDRQARELWSAERLGAQLAWFSVLVPALIVGFVIGTLEGPWWLAGAKALVLAGGTAALSHTAPRLRVLGLDHLGPAASWTCVIVNLVLALGLWQVARGRALRLGDDDQGRAERSPAWLAALHVVCMAALGIVGLREVQDRVVRAIEVAQPVAVRGEDGTARLFVENKDTGMWAPADDSGSPIGWTSVDLPDEAAEPVAWLSIWPHGMGWYSRVRASLVDQDDFPLAPSRVRRSIGRGLLHDTTLVRQTGGDAWHVVHVVGSWGREGQQERSVRRIVRRGDGTPLAPEARWLTSARHDVLAFDPRDGSLWASKREELTRGEPLRQLATPGDLRIEEVDQRLGLFLPRPGPGETYPADEYTQLQARTRAGWFAADGRDAWRPVGEVQRWSQFLGSGPGWVPWGGRSESFSPRPLRLDARIVDAEGRTVLSHTFRPWGAGRRSESVVAAATVVEPPLAVVLAYASGRHLQVLAPYVSEGSNGSTVLWSLAVGTLCAVLVWLRLRGFDMPARVSRVWIVGALLGGLTVLLAQWVFVRRRAWDRAGAPEAPQLLIQPLSRVAREALAH